MVSCVSMLVVGQAAVTVITPAVTALQSAPTAKQVHTSLHQPAAVLLLGTLPKLFQARLVCMPSHTDSKRRCISPIISLIL